jgi:ATP-dependent DNA helicase RecG
MFMFAADATTPLFYDKRMNTVDEILHQLAELIPQGRFKGLVTEGLEIKPVPADGGEWKDRHKSVNAFLNTRGGILILGVKAEGSRGYVLCGNFKTTTRE